MFDIFQIFNFFKKKFNKKDFLIIAALILIYFFTRLINLEKFPIFTDEGIYINWAKTAWHDASMRFISLTDGKQPLQTWATIPLLKIFPNHPLFAGRLFSVLTGFASLIGIFSLLFFLFDKKTAILGSFLYIFTPYFLFYDRMALTDSAVNMAFILILFFSILLIKTIRLDIALIFGLIGGLSLLTKSSAQLFLLLSAFAPIILKRKEIGFKKFVNFYLLLFLVFVLSFTIYNVQRLSPYMHYIGIKNTTFLMTKEEFLKAPFSLFWNNFKGVWTDIIWESGFVLPIFSLLGLLILIKKNPSLALYFLIWFFFPFFVICSISKVIFPRYLIFFASLFVIFASIYFSHLKKKKIYWFFFILLLLTQLFFDYKILFDFKNISFPPIDRGQYIEGAPAGWGVKEIIDFSIGKSKEKPVILLAEGNFGLIADMLRASLPRDGHQVEVIGYWPLDLPQLLTHQKDLEKKYVYAVFPHRTEFPSEWPIKLIKKFEKPGGKSIIYFFELK